MKARILFIVLAALTLVLAACSAPDPVATEAPKPQSENPPAGQPAETQPKDYPAPSAQPEAPAGQYPAPQANAQPAAQAGSLYPDSKNGDALEPEQVFGLLQNGEVTELVQEASGRVTVMLKDGRSLVTQTSDKAYFENMIKTCGEKCKSVKLTTK
jgi:hypothetical protein